MVSNKKARKGVGFKDVKKGVNLYRVSDIVCIRNGRVKVRWTGYKVTTWEPLEIIQEDVPDMVAEYRRKKKVREKDFISRNFPTEAPSTARINFGRTLPFSGSRENLLSHNHISKDVFYMFGV
jgi:hypothetical protein